MRTVNCTNETHFSWGLTTLRSVSGISGCKHEHEYALEYPLSDRPTRTTIDALRQTLAQVEEHSGLAPDDVALRELKRILLNRIADLEAAALVQSSPQDPISVAAGLNLITPPEDQPAVAVAVDLAITLLSGYLTPRPLEAAPAIKVPDASISRTLKDET